MQTGQQDLAPRSTGGAKQEKEYIPTFMQTGQQDLAPRSTGGAKQEQEYMPSFASTGQGDFIPVDPSKVGKQAKEQEYIPTFMQTGQQDLAPRSTGGAKQEKEYVPTFMQTGQQDLAPRSTGGAKQEKEYIPTFMQTGQQDLAPKSSGPRKQEEQYIPTFMQTEQPDYAPRSAIITESEQMQPSFTQVSVNAPNVFDPADIAKMKEAIRKASAIGSGTNTSSSSESIRYVENPAVSAKSFFTAVTATQASATFATVDLQNRIDTLHQNLIKNLEQQQAELSAMQEEAFNMIDEGTHLANSGNFTLAIEKYEDAIDMFNSMPGWADESNILYSRLNILQDYRVQSLSNPAEIPDSLLDQIQQALSGIHGEKFDPAALKPIDRKFLRGLASAKEKFKNKLQESEKTQHEIFLLFNSARDAVSSKSYESALAHYNQALLLLNSLGWVAQVSPVHALIGQIHQIQQSLDSSVSEDLTTDIMNTMSNDQIKAALQQQFEERRNKLQEIEEKRQKQEAAQASAFKIIDNAEALVQSEKFDEALGEYRKAAEILIGIGWQDQVQTINDRILQLRHEKEASIKRKQDAHRILLEKQQQEREFQEQMKAKVSQKNLAPEISPEQLQQMQQAAHQAQQEVSDLLAKANEFARNQQFDQSLAQLQAVKQKLIQLQWNEQLSFVDNLIGGVRSQQENYRLHQMELQAKAAKAREEQENFQKYLKQQAAELAAQREAEAQRLQANQQAREQQMALQNEAFSHIDMAEQQLRYNQFDAAVAEYSRAIELFVKMNWRDHIPHIQMEIEKTKRAKVSFEQNQSNAALEKQQAEVARQRALQREKELQSKEKQEAFSIKSMIRQVSNTKTQEENLQTARELERQKMQADILKWRDRKNPALDDLRSELLSSVDTSAIEQIRNEEKKEIDKAKQEMDDFRNLIRSAKKKTSG
jgi:hypothetical protein